MQQQNYDSDYTFDLNEIGPHSAHSAAYDGQYIGEDVYDAQEQEDDNLLEYLTQLSRSAPQADHESPHEAQPSPLDSVDTNASAATTGMPSQHLACRCKAQVISDIWLAPGMVLSGFQADKAGLQQVDVNKTNQIIFELSKVCIHIDISLCEWFGVIISSIASPSKNLNCIVQ